MDSTRLDHLTRILVQARSRRGLLAALGLAGMAISDRSAARNKNKNKQTKLKKNAFGCVNVGDPCRGKDSDCCSGMCQGKKPKHGKQDRSRCVAHDEGGCQLSDDSCAVAGTVTCTDGAGAICYRTTGKAGFCGLSFIGACAECARDIDCAPDWGAGAACVVCAGDCAETGHRFCIPSAL